MSGNPFIHLFTVADEHYFYDVNKNNILQIDSDLFEYLSNENNEIIPNDNVKKKIEDLKHRGYLSCKRIEKIEHPMSHLMSSYLTTKLQSICLQVTQDCNLRCNYCVYSGGYNNRVHNKKVMSLETAKKAVDFLINNSSESDIVCISFYGGEPLLNFELIKKVVLYATEEYSGKQYNFTLTTNGTVFNKENLEFMEHYGFGLTISLDGNKEIQDLNRKFRNSDQGTFEIIMKNLALMKENYVNLYSNLMFSVVLSVASDFVGCNEFFTSSEVVNDVSLLVSSVSNRYKDGDYNIQKEANIIAQRYEIFKCILILIGKIKEDNCSNMVKDYYYEVRARYKQFYITEDEVSNSTHPSGPCLPGAFRLFINADGNFYPCEKISEKSEVGRIGDLESGFNMMNINNALNVGKIGNDLCKNCWAYRYCKVCISVVDDLTSLSLEKKVECCNKVKKEVETMMQEYCFISKYNNVFN